jgi:hypothetical protein
MGGLQASGGTGMTPRYRSALRARLVAIRRAIWAFMAACSALSCLLSGKSLFNRSLNSAGKVITPKISKPLQLIPRAFRLPKSCIYGASTFGLLLFSHRGTLRCNILFSHYSAILVD